MLEWLSQHETYEQATPSSLERDELILVRRLQVKDTAQRISTKVPSQVEWKDLPRAGMPGRLGATGKLAPSRGIEFRDFADGCIPALFRRAYDEGNGKNPLRQGVAHSVVAHQGNATASNQALGSERTGLERERYHG